MMAVFRRRRRALVCRQAVALMTAYLDGALDDRDRGRLEAHLDDCPPCAEGYDFEIEIRRVIAVSCTEQAPEDLRRRIGEALGLE